jgi:hypothetical protein
MISTTTARNDNDLRGILALQRENMRDNLSADEKSSQGFLSLAHSFDDLERMNRIEPHIVALDGAAVAGYVLAMTAASKHDFPMLEPMFALFNTLQYGGKPISDYRYMVVGQVCVGKHYRGQQVFDRLYAAYKSRYAGKYALAVTEIAAANTRSRRAHARVGFEEIALYTAPDGVDWVVVVWDWRSFA